VRFQWRAVFLFLSTFSLVLFFQNCTRSYFKPIGNAITFESLRSESGNGGVYDGKTYYRFIPGFKCEDKETFKDLIISKENKFYIIENEIPKCATEGRELKSSEVKVSQFQDDVISYNDLIFTRNDIATELKIPEFISEVLCRDNFENPQFEFSTQYDQAANVTTTTFYSKDEKTVDKTSVRSVTTNKIEYSSFNGQVKFEIILNQVISSASAQHKGLVTAKLSNWDSKVTSTNLTCVLGSYLDANLSFTGASNARSPVASRIFTEFTSPAWKLTGSCNPANGNVIVSGDINAPQTVTCESLSGGAFALIINYSTSDPFFNSATGLTREIKISQKAASAKTFLYKALSTEMPEIITTNLELQKIKPNDSKAHYILGNDLDLSNKGTTLKDNWDPAPWFTGMSPGFMGTLDGDAKSISNLDRTTGYWSACLFEATQSASIKNLKLLNMNLGMVFWSAASTRVAAVSCQDRGSTFDNIYASGKMEINDSKTNVGGLVSSLNGSIVSNSIADFVITGNTAANAGGLIGSCYGCLISNSESHGSLNIASINSQGGLIGYVRHDQNSTATEILNSYSSVDVGGGEVNSGFIGIMESSQAVIMTHVYSMGNITVPAGKKGGPIIGAAGPTGISYNMSSYYRSSSTCTNCTDFSGNAVSASGFVIPSSFFAWDFTNIWEIIPGNAAPTLRR
jgi:hypothetical protein